MGLEEENENENEKKQLDSVVEKSKQRACRENESSTYENKTNTYTKR